jgi:hypothetical protein
VDGIAEPMKGRRAIILNGNERTPADAIAQASSFCYNIVDSAPFTKSAAERAFTFRNELIGYC